MRWKIEHILKKGGGDILLEDEYLIAINKPANLLVLSDRYDKTKHSLYELLKDAYGSIYIAHRIDKETSGVIVFAKTAETHAFLNDAFEHRQIKKSYYAIVVGTPQQEFGNIDLPISENIHNAKKMRIDIKHGKKSCTEFKVLEQFVGYALLEVKPLTGRTHQIRVHLSAIGLPILADSLYGDGKGFFLSSIKRNYQSNEEEQPLLNRTALHAHSLEFTHPITKNQTRIEAPPPNDLHAVLKALRKYQRVD